MKVHYYILLFVCLTLGCSQNSKTEVEYIQNLEKKNSILEKELETIKSERKGSRIPKLSSQDTNPKDYFTIGSTERDVVDIMGQPNQYVDFGYGSKKLRYGRSSVDLQDDKVVSFANRDVKLKVKVSK